MAFRYINQKVSHNSLDYGGGRKSFSAVNRIKVYKMDTGIESEIIIIINIIYSLLKTILIIL